MENEGSQNGTGSSGSGCRVVCITELILQNSKTTLNFAIRRDEEIVSQEASHQN